MRRICSWIPSRFSNRTIVGYKDKEWSQFAVYDVELLKGLVNFEVSVWYDIRSEGEVRGHISEQRLEIIVGGLKLTLKNGINIRIHFNNDKSLLLKHPEIERYTGNG